jgi:hypothetical protein
MSSPASSSRKRLFPNNAPSAEEQGILNGHLCKAALANDPDLVLHYLSQGAHPSSELNVAYELVPVPETPELKTVSSDVKVSSASANNKDSVRALHAAIINCCWSTDLFNVIKSATSKVVQIVKVLLEAGADTSLRSTFTACHIPGYNYIAMQELTPLDFAMHLQSIVRGKIGHAHAQELQPIIDLLRAPADAVVALKGDFVATIDRDSTGSIHLSAVRTFRSLFESASATHSDIAFECPDELAAEASLESGALHDLCEITELKSAPPKRSKKSAASAACSSSSSGALSLDSGAALSAPAGSTLVYAHRIVLSAASPYFDTLFSGAWSDVSDGRIVAKQNARAIRRMLEFVYSGDMTAAQAVKLPFAELVQLHEASAEYQIDALRAMTEAALAEQVSAANLVGMMQLAILHDQTSCALTACQLSSHTVTNSSSSSSLSSPSSLEFRILEPCMLMNACVAVLKDDMTLLTSDEVVGFLAGQPKLRTFLRAALASNA